MYAQNNYLYESGSVVFTTPQSDYERAIYNRDLSQIQLLDQQQEPVESDDILFLLSAYYEANENNRQFYLEALDIMGPRMPSIMEIDDKYMDTPLSIALYYQDQGMAEMLVTEYNQDIDVELTRSEKYNNDEDAIPWLIKHANLNNAKIDYLDFLYHSIKYGADIEDINRLVNAYVAQDKDQALEAIGLKIMPFIVELDEDVLFQMMLDVGVDLNTIKEQPHIIDKNLKVTLNSTLLYDAAYHGSIEIAEILTESGRNYDPYYFDMQTKNVLTNKLIEQVKNNPYEDHRDRWKKVLYQVNLKGKEIEQGEEKTLYSAILANDYNQVEELIGGLAYDPEYEVNGSVFSASDLAYSTYRSWKNKGKFYNINIISIITEEGYADPVREAADVYYEAIRNQDWEVFELYTQYPVNSGLEHYMYDYGILDSIVEKGHPRFVSWLGYVLAVEKPSASADESPLDGVDFAKYFIALINAGHKASSQHMLQYVTGQILDTFITSVNNDIINDAYKLELEYTRTFDKVHQSYYIDKLVQEAIDQQSVSALYILHNNNIKLDQSQPALIRAIKAKSDRLMLGTLIKLGADMNARNESSDIFYGKNISAYEMAEELARNGYPEVLRLFDEYAVSMSERQAVSNRNQSYRQNSSLTNDRNSSMNSSMNSSQVERILALDESAIAGSSTGSEIQPESLSNISRWNLPLAKY